MVATQFDELHCHRRFLIRPNCSMSWRNLVRFYAGIFIVSMSIAAGFAMKGAWLILPFAGLEMLVLGVALYIVSHRSARWQEIAIEAETVSIANGAAGKEQGRRSFQRTWIQVELEDAPINGYPSRLLVGSHGQRVEVGACLNEDEKRSLAAELRLAVQQN